MLLLLLGRRGGRLETGLLLPLISLLLQLLLPLLLLLL